MNQQNKLPCIWIKNARERFIFLDSRLFNVLKPDFTYLFPIQKIIFRDSNFENIIIAKKTKTH